MFWLMYLKKWIKMKPSKTVNIKIQNSGADGTSNTKGSSRELASYLEHEDPERLAQGKPVYPFTTPNGVPVDKEEVIAKIDRNRSHLGKNDDKFLHLIISPSKKEVEAMGKDEKELYEKGIQYARLVSDAYAQNFHREGIESSDDLLIFWKPHFTRGENDEEQFHLHAIVSRKSKDGEKSLHALTPHRNTEQGAVKGGFDRSAFFERGEKLFDQLFNYERKVEETFAYQNAMTHGTAEEKAQQAERLAQENAAGLRTEMEAAFNKRRKRKREQDEAEELNEAIKHGNLALPSPEKSLADALEIASLSPGIQECFATSEDRFFLELNLTAIGLSCRSLMAPDGGVQDLLFTRRGQVIKASDIIDEAQLKHLLDRWEALTGEEPAYKVKTREAVRQQEEKFRKLKEALTPETTPKRRGLHL